GGTRPRDARRRDRSLLAPAHRCRRRALAGLGRACRTDRRVNAYDLLLEWASERGEGSWRNWREACASLEIAEPSQAALGASALGHVEFEWVDNRLACAPPTA